MDKSDRAQCISELASKRVVFEQPKRSGRGRAAGLFCPGQSNPGADPVSGDVSLPAKPFMLCSFGLKFTDWVRDVAAPCLTLLAYTGQKLVGIETGPGFACTCPLRTSWARCRANMPKAMRSTSCPSCSPINARRSRSRITSSALSDDGLRLFQLRL